MRLEPLGYLRWWSWFQAMLRFGYRKVRSDGQFHVESNSVALNRTKLVYPSRSVPNLNGVRIGSTGGG